MKNHARYKKPELLSPAGNPECFFAAVENGADAVYFGLENFSARAKARNFTLDDASCALAYARLNKVKVYIALNTVMKTQEQGEVVDYLLALDELQPDAIIIQDLGLFYFIQTHFPHFNLHASTQMAVHNLAGARQLNRMGFKRAVLARELSFGEICNITNNTPIETEIFIHGALCYSYSGLCLLSSMIGGRSGNRGRCAQPCRLCYQTSSQKKGYHFSMKDLQTISCIETVFKTGVHSCKIEGRMKSPEYVAVVTHHYRMAIDGKLHDVDRAIHCMKTVFSRETTSFHLLSNVSQQSNKRKTDGQVKPVNIVNPFFPANTGLYAGVVISAWGKKLMIKAEADIGVRDLLQVFEEDGEKPVLLHVKEIHVNGKKSYRIKAGQTATIHTNCHCKHGTKLYVLSSQKIKEEFGAKVPKKRVRNKIPVDLKVTLQPDCITINGVAKHVAFNTKFPMKLETGINRTLETDALKDCFSRLGNTIFELQDFHVSITGDMFVPLSILNAIRREYFHKLSELWETDRQHRTEKSKEWIRLKAIGLSESSKQIMTIQATKKDTQLSVKIDTIRYLEFLPLEKVSLIYISLSWKDSFFYDFLFRRNGKETQKNKEDLFNILLKLRDKVVFSLPLIMRDKQEELSSEYISVCVRRLISWGFKQFQIGNLGALEVLRDFNIRLYADYPLYCLNPLSAVTLMELGFRRYTLSPEDDYQNMRTLFSEKAEVVIYQDTPLFISDVCFWANLNRSCPGQDRCNFKQEEIQNEYGDQFTVINDNCKTVVTGSKPFSLIQFLPQMVSEGQRNFRIDLCYKNYSPEMIQELFYRIENKNMIENTITGNFKGRLW